MAKSLKNVKKGDKVYLKGFTGMRLGEFEVIAANNKQFKVAKKDGTQMTFDKTTGRQVDAKNEKYANTASAEAPVVKAKAEKPAKETKKAEKPAKGKKVEPEPEDEEFDEDEDFEDELDEDEDDDEFEDE
jgi:single-stranded DNA-binding protein